jgi:hypothetical protein
MIYYSLVRNKQYEMAQAMVDSDASLRAHLQEQDPVFRARHDGTLNTSYWRGRSFNDRQQFQRDRKEYTDIQRGFDSRLREYWDRPWDPAVRQIKAERNLAVTYWLLTHPDVRGVFAQGMTEGEWAKWAHDLDVDDQVDKFFALDKQLRPDPDKYGKSDKEQLRYARDQRRYNAWRRRFLETHPDVEARLVATSTDMQAAWKEWEATKAAEFDHMNEVQIKLLEEKLKGEDADRDLIAALYAVQEMGWTMLNFDGAYLGVKEGDGIRVRGAGGAAAAASLGGTGVARLAMLPGVETLKMLRMTESEKADYLAKKAKEDAYRAGMDKIMSRMDRAKERGMSDEKLGGLWYRLLDENPDIRDEYLSRNEEAAANYRDHKRYMKALAPWIDAIKAQDWDRANRAFDAMPDWAKREYYKNNPRKARQQRQGSAYMAAMQRWVGLLQKGDQTGARKFFDSLPDWVKERYFKSHPDQRYSLGLSHRWQELLTTYFMADEPNRLNMLKTNAALRRFLQQHKGDDDRRAMVMAFYSMITDPWAKRVYREKYPEYFSEETKAQGRLASVRADLRKNPQLREMYEEAVALQTELYTNQLRLQGTRPPKPMDAVHISDLKKRRRRIRRRAAHFSAHAMKHEALRHG